jgi:hypothetical protein
MTAGAGNTFAVLPGTVTTAGGTTAVKFTIDPAHFHLPNGKFTLGIDVAPDPTGTLHPLIAAVRGPNGDIVPQTFHSIYDPHLTNTQVGLGAGTSAVLTPIQIKASNRNAPVTYEVDVKGVAGSSGKFLLGFYLPGDANGDGVVNQSDITIVKSELGAKAGGAKYTFDADVNRDGRIGPIDLRYTQQNQGVSTDITPVVSANLDPTGMLDVSARETRQPTAHFTGTLTPGASVKFAEVNNKVKPVATTADAKGNYTLTVPLALGSNTFHVTTQDAFGQSITGTLAPVNYSTAPAVTPATLATVVPSSPAVTVKSS